MPATIAAAAVLRIQARWIFICNFSFPEGGYSVGSFPPCRGTLARMRMFWLEPLRILPRGFGGRRGSSAMRTPIGTDGIIPVISIDAATGLGPQNHYSRPTDFAPRRVATVAASSRFAIAQLFAGRKVCLTDKLQNLLAKPRSLARRSSVPSFVTCLVTEVSKLAQISGTDDFWIRHGSRRCRKSFAFNIFRFKSPIWAARRTGSHRSERNPMPARYGNWCPFGRRTFECSGCWADE